MSSGVDSHVCAKKKNEKWKKLEHFSKDMNNVISDDEILPKADNPYSVHNGNVNSIE